MSITERELREYCRPMLRRKGFRFSRAGPLIEEDSLRSLAVAKAFSMPDGQRDFLYSLRLAPGGMRRGIHEALDRKRSLGSQNGRGHAARLELLSDIQEVLIAHGIFAQFGRPATTGIILGTRRIGDIPVYFVLTESRSTTSVFSGRVSIGLDGRKQMAISVTGAAARLMETLDLWLRDPASSEDDRFERRLMRADRESLRAFLEGKSLAPDEPIFLMAINLISMRSCISRLRSLASASPSARSFLLSALNSQLDSVLAHETAHLVEREANGSIPLPKESKEILGHLLEAVHGKADDAFQSLLHREFDFAQRMPALKEDIGRKGLGALLEDSAYLSGWARAALDERFLALSGRTHEQVVDTGAIRAVQSGDFIDEGVMPLIEKAMYNPSNHRTPPPR